MSRIVTSLGRRGDFPLPALPHDHGGQSGRISACAGLFLSSSICRFA
jgi:hypothetical protein